MELDFVGWVRNHVVCFDVHFAENIQVVPMVQGDEIVLVVRVNQGSVDGYVVRSFLCL